MKTPDENFLRTSLYSTMKNKTHFGLLEFDCDFQDALLILISLNMRET